jgi:hypothetical protein
LQFKKCLFCAANKTSGDVLSIDTASITGESLPRNYPSEQYGKTILSGTTVKAGEAYCIVRKTGINTEVMFDFDVEDYNGIKHSNCNTYVYDINN